MKHYIKFTLLLLLSLVFVGCGGSGSGDDKPTQDLIAPTITLVGGDISLTVGDTYQEPGTTVTDNIDTGLTASSSGSVDTSVPGSYLITYTATDLSGNTSNKTRTVTVQLPPDTEAPVIVLNGNGTVNLIVSETYVEQGVTISDNIDTDLTAVMTGSVDTDTAGSYTITYTVTDSANNESSISRTVIVEENITPTPNSDAYIFYSEKNDSFAMEYWGDTWGTGTPITDQTSDTTYVKTLEITKSSSWGTVVAWGNEPENTINIAAYTHAKFKVKTESFTSVQVVVQSATKPESSITYSFASATDLGNGWVEIQAMLPGFTDMTWFSLNFMGDAGTTVLLADVYFTTLDAEPVTGPPQGAPVPPDYADSDVIVLFSDTLKQDSFIGVWNSNWWNAPIYFEGDVNGNNFAKYEITAGGVAGGVTGLEFGYENGELDASTKTTWNFDLFVEPGITKVEVQLVSVDGGAKYTLENPTADQWISFAIPFKDLTDNDGNGIGVLNSSLLQSIGIQLWGPEGKSVYVDNIYFSGTALFYDLAVTVLDNNNSALANAKVSVGNITSNTNSEGVAVLNLPEGEHKVVADASGFGVAQDNQSIAGGEASLSISVVPLNNGPTIAAPTPTASNDEAFVLYSDALTVDKPISYWSDNWWNAPTFAEITIGSDKIAKFQITPGGVAGGVTGIQYGVQGGVVDASTATGLRFDLYATSGITQAVYQIVSASGPGVSTMLPVPTEQWITVELPFSELVDSTGNFDPSKLSQFGLQLWGSTSDAVYLDNIYFY
jgi:hypothetical protein